mmetsp:Transcript_136842/g.425083  ORF Transcript_136842/g.425083 Transcript_136842/m.425083 type:complete len:487 (+) Transcript_136842:115-1575(+)
MAPLGEGRPFIAIACALHLPVAALVLSRSGGLDWPTTWVVTLATLAVIGWSMRPLDAPMEFVALLLLTLLPMTGALSWEKAWSGASSQGLWLIFCGMALGAGLSETPLARRLALLTCRAGTPWRSLLMRLHVLGAIMALLVPSQVVRVQLILPFAFELLTQCGALPHSKESAAIVLSLVVSTNHCGSGVLTGALPNFLAHNAMHEAGIDVSWGFWFLAAAPGFYAGSGLASLGIMLALFGRLEAPALRGRPEDAEDPSSSAGAAGAVAKGAKDPASGPLSSTEKQVIFIFALGFAAWASDSLHRTPPVHVGLVTTLMMYWPRFGPLPFDVLRKKVNWSLLLAIAAIMALSTALVSSEPLLAAVKELISAMLGACPHSLRYFVLLATACLMGTLMNGAVATGIMVPIVCMVAEGSGLDPRLASVIVTMAQNVFIFPHSCAPILIVMSLTSHVLKRREVTLVLACNSLATLLLLAPLTFVWWYLLGWY